MSPEALTAAPVILALVLMRAGLGKLGASDLVVAEEWTRMGVPEALNRSWLRRFHPWGELLLAVALLFVPGPLSIAAALVAGVLFSVYLALVVAVRGNPDATCACFGSAQTQPITARTVLRNSVLFALAILAVVAALLVGSPIGVVLSSPAFLLWYLALGLAWWTGILIIEPSAGYSDEPSEGVQPGEAGLGVGNQDRAEEHGAGAASDELEEDYVRTLTPHAIVFDEEGEEVNIYHASQARAQLLIVLSTTCGYCPPVAAKIPQWQKELPVLDVRRVINTSASVVQERRPEWSAGSWFDANNHFAAMLQIRAYPAAVLLGTDGMLAGGPVHGAASIEEFVEDIKAQLADE